MNPPRPQQRESTPRGAEPSVTPTAVGYDNHSFILQAIMENQRTLGELKEAVKTINTSVEKQGDKISRHGTIIATASGAVGVILIIFGFIIDKLWDKISALVTLNIPQ